MASLITSAILHSRLFFQLTSMPAVELEWLLLQTATVPLLYNRIAPTRPWEYKDTPLKSYLAQLRT
jgi:hypothetical protein